MTIQPGAATFFFVNEDGVAFICKHILDIQQYKVLRTIKLHHNIPEVSFKNRV